MITINTDWLCMHAIIFMGGAAASETLIGEYICTIGGCRTPQKQPRENTAAPSLQLTLFLWVVTIKTVKAKID